MKTQELYHGTTGDNIVAILNNGVMKPVGGEIYFVKHESQLHSSFVHGADTSRRAAFVLNVRIHIPEDATLKPDPRPGNPDCWILRTSKPVAAEALKLFVRHKPGEPPEVIHGRERIAAYLQPIAFHVRIKRKYSFAQGIVGELYANGVFVCYTLELAWFWNENNKSCVPRGKYSGFLRYDHTDKWRIELSGVPGDREHVQIHIGNYPKDIKGCVVVGTSYGPDAVFDSASAYKKLKDAYQHAYGPITVEFEGLLATPWGDYPGVRTNLA